MLWLFKQLDACAACAHACIETEQGCTALFASEGYVLPASNVVMVEPIPKDAQ